MADWEGQVRAFKHLGATYESMGKLDEAIKFHERHLAIATQNNDIIGKAEALNCLGNLIKLLNLNFTYICW